jgi:predicted Rossmann fold nucleotide-binding protein DprA/Smf involved in DNA uptake
MIIGFTGTRKGMTDEQKKKIRLLMQTHKPDTVTHGCCVGADLHFHVIATGLDCVKRYIFYPSTIKEQSFVAVSCETTIVYPPSPPLERNRRIVKLCDALWACPKGTKEELRSGTWATIRYARKIGRKVVIVYPDGSVQ